MLWSRRSVLLGSLGSTLVPRSSVAAPSLAYGDCDPLVWRIATVVPPSRSGLMSTNRDGFTQLGAQRAIPRFLGGATMLRDEQLVRAGMVGLQRTFDYRKHPTGFPFSQSKMASPADFQQSKLLTEAFFMMELLQAWHIAQSTEFGKRFAPEIRTYVDTMQIEARAIEHELDEMMVSNLQAANRVIICLRMAALLRAAYGMELPMGRYINAVISLQTQDGYFLEKHGADVSYNAASILFASQTLFVLQSDSLRASVIKSVDWLDNKIGESGELLPASNTRTAGQEMLNGKPKEPNYGEIASALVLGGALSGKRELVNKGNSVWRKATA